MRQTLFRIWMERPWAFWTSFPDQTPQVGVCWVVLFLAAIFVIVHLVRGQKSTLLERNTWLSWVAAIVLLSGQPVLGILPETLPVFGYGTMVLIGFVTALWFSCVRAKSVGFDPDIILDAAFWVLGLGIVGGRLAFLIQYGHFVFANSQGPFDLIFRAVNLSEGGLVQIGGLVGGTLGFLLFCYRRNLNFFEFADIMTPAIFIGIGFGRIGCLLNGCCYGDPCDLPWGIQFPAESVTFGELASRGFVDPDAATTHLMHPTQIYSSINGFILAFVTANYYWYRKHSGDVFALGAILYAITRTQLEFLRADELGQLGTGLTISQLYSVGILAFGVIVLLTGRMRSKPQQMTAVPTT
ncbi:prolipoprotein diacylglyceryl transferase [Thalassoglobus sp. JC818]|uniref:prolipoprotein diacylglyceryl transferase n=1 Tax=Thalassoglobus sp. JC818 TaxID=3232136 RepID=UPI0034573DEC